MNYKITNKFISLASALFIYTASFGQLNNCVVTMDHPLVLEIRDSINANKNYFSILAYTIFKRDQLGLYNNKVLNLAYAWAVSKKIKDPRHRKDEEFKFLNKILSVEEFERLLFYIRKVSE